MKKFFWALGSVGSAILGTLAFAWVCIVLLMCHVQDSLIFPAPGGIDALALDSSAAEVGAEPFHLTSEDSVDLYGWMRRPNPGKDRGCAVLYFHGNGETVVGSVPVGRMVARRGCTFLTIAYRGYPGSSGVASEDGITKDARALWAHALSLGIPKDRIMLQGLSLGGGAAIRLAAEVQPVALVVGSSFTSVVDVAAATYPWLPVDSLLRTRFESLQRAPGITAFTLVMHGDADTVIPVEEGRNLAAAFPNARYVEVIGGEHQELELVDDTCRTDWETLVDWLGEPQRADRPSGW